MDGAGSYSVAHRAGLLPTELTGTGDPNETPSPVLNNSTGLNKTRCRPAAAQGCPYDKNNVCRPRVHPILRRAPAGGSNCGWSSANRRRLRAKPPSVECRPPPVNEPRHRYLGPSFVKNKGGGGGGHLRS